MSQVLRLNKSFSLLSRLRRPMTVGTIETCETQVFSHCASCESLRLFAAAKKFHLGARRYSSESANPKEQFVPSHKQKWKKKKLHHREEIKSCLIEVIDARAKQLACKIVKANAEDILLQTIQCNKNINNNAFLILPTSSKTFLDKSSQNALPIEARLDSQSVDGVLNVNSVDLSMLTNGTLNKNWNDRLDSFKTQLKSLHVSSQNRIPDVDVMGADSKFSIFEDPLHNFDEVTFEKIVSSEKSEQKPLDPIIHVDRELTGKKTKSKPVSRHKKTLSVNANVLKTKTLPVGKSSKKLQPILSSRPAISDSKSIPSPLLSQTDALEELDFPLFPDKDDSTFSRSVFDSDGGVDNLFSDKDEIDFSKSVIDGLEEVQGSLLTDIKDGNVLSKPVLESTDKSKTKSQEKEAKGAAQQEKTKPIYRGNPEKQNRLLNQDLLSFVETCCFSNKQAHAHMILKFQHFAKSLSPETVIKDITIHNTLMHSWAKLGKLQEIKEVFSFMKEGGLKPNMQSYATCLECLGRQKNFDIEMCERILQDMKRDGFDVKDLFNECTFKRDERHFILQALRTADPNFVPHPIPDPEPYKGDLLENLHVPLPEDQVVEQNPYAGIVSTGDLRKRAELQMQMELKGNVTVKSIVSKPACSSKTTEYRDKVDDVKEEWRIMLVRAFERRLHDITRKSREEHTMTLYPYMALLSPLDMVECIMMEIEQISMASDSFSICMDQLCRRAGMRVYNKYMMQDKVRSKYAKKMSRLYEEYMGHYNSESFPFQNHRECWQHLMKNASDGASLDVAERPWSSLIIKMLGKTLYDIIMNDVKINSNMLKKKEKRRMVPAFYTIYRNYGHRVYQEIKPHPVVVKLFHIADVAELTFNTSDLPMVIPPVPWVSKNLGGFLLGSAQLVRLPPMAQNQTDQLDKTPPSQTYAVLDSLNTLGACAWIINKPMLDLIIHIFNNKGMKNLDIPPPVTECPPLPKTTLNMTPQEKSKIFRERLRLRQQKSEMYSLWCQELYRLSIANKFRDDTFWFPHNLDFRGRTYPYPPHFNHLGSDVARSILLFAKGKPLGEKGLDWLKIHLINLTGFKKRSSNVDRLKFANEMMPDIMDSADNPLTGKKWWQTSDEPWQTLACCKEITNAVRSPDPEQYVSHFSVHQDGSCNGLQHYAALGRDQAGAESVNLHPFSVPQDVYSDIAELVEAFRLKDENDGVEIAGVLKGYVRRKVIKQTVMTTVYGVTKYGAKLQILRQLKDIPEFPQRHVWAASIYLTEKTFQCLMEMFSATKEIQDWLTTSAHLISTVRHKPVEWITPLGLPVVQPYHRPMRFNKYGIQIFDAWSQFEKPNSMKQKNAFPPNFIHSLDSTHMMLTSLHCLQAGITFVSVHDCYWTHPCDVALMNKICRMQFVSLHKQPILEDLSKFLVEKFGSNVDGTPQEDSKEEKNQTLLNSVLRKVPQKGSFNLDNVLESTYFFS